MTELQCYKCPFCDYEAGTEGSVIGHITASTSGDHAGVSGPSVREQVEKGTVESTAAEQTEEQASSELTTAQFPEPEPETEPETTTTESTTDNNESCCDAPELEGAAGDRYRLESGAIIELEQNEQICLNCDHIHE